MLFLLAGGMAILAVTLLHSILSRVSPEIEKKERTRSARSIAVIWAVITLLYFTNLIPPLPLALKDAGIYHAVQKNDDGTYSLTGEARTWYQSILPFPTTFHKQAGKDVYAFTAVFAPTGLSTPIVYVWQYFDETIGDWVTKSTFTLSINGGRDGGYRGYSLSSDPKPGKWRVSVRTTTGLVIGRFTFYVVESTSSPVLETTTH
jgi:hypothetical protein